MGYIESLVLRPGQIRDWKRSQPAAANVTIKAINEEAVALDLFIRNRGAAVITVAIDGQPVITIDAGDVFTVTDTIMDTIAIVAAVQYDLLLTGIKLQTLKSMGAVR